MKRVNRLLLVIGIVLFYNGIYAQKNTWSIGFYCGLRGEILSDIKEEEYYSELFERDYISTSEDISSLISMSPLMFNVSYNIMENLSIVSGLGFCRYHTEWKISKSEYSLLSRAAEDYILINDFYRYSLQIPLLFKFKQPIGRTGLSVFSVTGVIFDISDWTGRFLDNIIQDSMKKPIEYQYKEIMCNQEFNSERIYPQNYRKLNILINTGLGLTYTFKRGIAISVSGEYFLGTRRSESVITDIQYKEVVTNALVYRVTNKTINKNDYWNVSLSVSYAFKQKNKE
jgi:hypothetical protein